jgi:hypothetical protein
VAGVKGRSGRKGKVDPKKLLKSIVPVNDLYTDEELKLYNSLIDVYLMDFDEDDLTSSDMDDIIDLAKNRVIEIRLLKTSKESPDRQIDISAALDKLRKQNDKIKENLSSRRKDRIDPNKYKGFSIVDLAVAFDSERKMALQDKTRKLLEKEKEILKERDKKNYSGNRYDKDASEEDKE